MYFDTVPNSNIQAAAGVVQSAQPSSSTHNPVSLFLRRSNHVLLDKRPSKRQRNALYVNSRHVASHHPSLKEIQGSEQDAQSLLSQASQSDASIRQDQLEPVLGDDDMSHMAQKIPMKANIPSPQVLEDTTNDTMEIDFQSSDSSSLDDETISTASVSSKANVSTHSNDDTFKFTQSFDTMVSMSDKASNQVKKESPPPQATLYPGTTASHNQPIMSPASIKHMAQAGPMEKVQSWEAILKYIQKQLQNYELFGDKLVFTAEHPDFLTVLKKIDQRKNWITYQEEQATNLAYYIKEILVNNGRVIDRESKKLAVQIADNFDQRFRNQRYFGPTM